VDDGRPEKPEKPDKGPKGKGSPGEPPSDVVDVRRHHGRRRKWLPALRRIHRAIKAGKDVPVKRVKQALHLTEKIAEFIKEKSRLPDGRKEKILGRLERYAKAFTEYLEQPAPVPVPIPEPEPAPPRPIVGPCPAPIGPEQGEHLELGLPSEGLIA